MNKGIKAIQVFVPNEEPRAYALGDGFTKSIEFINILGEKVAVKHESNKGLVTYFVDIPYIVMGVAEGVNAEVEINGSK